jgi:hypothetical protein
VTLAYTIGNEKSYDLALLDTDVGPPLKTGVRPDWDPPYTGGCIWRSAQEARAYIDSQGDRLGFTAAVYELALPTGWEQDVSPEPSTEGPFHHLLHDALIVRKVLLSIVPTGA